MALTRIEELAGIGLAAEVAGVIGPDVNAAVTAAGSTIADATALTERVNVVTTAASGTGVKLPNVSIGDSVIVQNLGANDLEVYPESASGIINGASAGDAITLAAATDVIGVFIRASATRWVGFVVAGPDT